MPCCHRPDCRRPPGTVCKERLREAVEKIKRRDAELLLRLAR